MICGPKNLPLRFQSLIQSKIEIRAEKHNSYDLRCALSQS
jgi:hypothetical protein